MGDTLGMRLKAVRKFLGLSQEQMANIYGVHKQTIFKWESGERNAPMEYLMFMIERFNVNPTWLLTGEGPMFREKEDREVAGILSDIQKIKYSLSEEDYKKVLKSIRDILDIVGKRDKSKS